MGEWVLCKIWVSGLKQAEEAKSVSGCCMGVWLVTIWKPSWARLMPCPNSCIQGFAQHHRIDNLGFSEYISAKEIHYCVQAGKGRGVWHAISNKNHQVSR